VVQPVGSGLTIRKPLTRPSYSQNDRSPLRASSRANDAAATDTQRMEWARSKGHDSSISAIELQQIDTPFDHPDWRFGLP
jgi:hypothetical protein